MNLTEHFTREELIDSSTATRYAVDNTPRTPEIESALARTAEGLERVRRIVGGKPIIVDSGYRSPLVNRLVLGAANSQHTTGEAADIRVVGMTPREVAETILDHEAFVAFDQLILEGTWVHISFSERARRDVLTARFTRMGTTYTKGLA